MNRTRLLRACCLIFLVFSLLPGAVVAAAGPPSPLTGTVTWIYDADTVEVAPHGKVRLLGIDAPEKTASDRDQNFTRLGIALKQLRSAHGAGIAYGINHLKGKTVTLVTDTTPRDRFGRLLAYVRLPDGRLFNRLLLEEGLVIVYRRFDFVRKADFLAAEAEAKQRRAGLWAAEPHPTAGASKTLK